MIYLDNAATTGMKPKTVINAVVSGLKNYSANPGRGGHKTSIEAAQKIYEVRNKICKYFNCGDVNSVCFTPGCTASINYVLCGCLKNGDHVIISSLEHNAVLRPLVSLKEKKNIDIDILKIDINSPESCVSELKRLIKSNTKMVFITHASNVFGTVLPVKEIGEICEEKGILFGVDAAQSAGHIPIDVMNMKIDYLCVAPHKGLYSPMGCGILIAEKNIDSILIKGGTGVNSISPNQPEDFPERIESGTLNLPAILGIGAGIDFVNNPALYPYKKRERNLILFLKEELKRINSLTYTCRLSDANQVPVVSFNIMDKSSEEVAAFLSANNIAVRGGLHCAPLAHKFSETLDIGTVRVSTSLFSTEKDIESLIAVLKKL